MIELGTCRRNPAGAPFGRQSLGLSEGCRALVGSYGGGAGSEHRHALATHIRWQLKRC